jgi:hypothetical protein
MPALHPNPEFHPVVTEAEIDAALKAADHEREEAIKQQPSLRELLYRTSMENWLMAHIGRGVPGAVVQLVPRPHGTTGE